MRHLTILLVLSLIAACGKDEGKPAPAQNTSSIQMVSTVPLNEAVIYPRLTAQAQVVSRNISNMAAQISARVSALPAEPGQRIAQGTIVARLDCTDYRIALTQAQAALDATEARLQLVTLQFKRSEELAAKNFISGDALDQRRTEVNVARADRDLQASQVAGAQSNVGKCTISSPFPAIVESVSGNVGELANPGTPLVTLWDMQAIEVSAQVQAKDADSLARANGIVFVTPDGMHELKLKRVSQAMSEAGRTQEARLVFVKGMPKPGATGQIQWQSIVPHIPADLLVMRNGTLGVFHLDNGKARFLPIGDAQEGRPAPIEPIHDMQLITEGRFSLRDGQSVKLNPAHQ